MLFFADHRYVLVSTVRETPTKWFQKRKLITALSKPNCLQSKFRDILLVVVYNYPYYDSIPHLTHFYRPMFPRIIFCGPPGNVSHHVTTIDVHRGILGYECLGKTIREHPGYKGYFYINDDVILNYWNLGEFNTTTIWESPSLFSSANMTGQTPEDWYWWVSPYGLIKCRQACEEVAAIGHNSTSTHAFLRWPLAFLYLNSNNSLKCFSGRSDIFYIPQKHARTFSRISSIFYEHKVFLEIAVPTILRLLDLESNINRLPGYYIPGDVRKKDLRVTDSRFFWSVYFWKRKEWFIHPFKLHHSQLDKKLNHAMLKHYLTKKGTFSVHCT